eukprot:scaffold1542_cov251-Chaetoceros_neogracile.AAC.1
MNVVFDEYLKGCFLEATHYHLRHFFNCYRHTSNIKAINHQSHQSNNTQAINFKESNIFFILLACNTLSNSRIMKTYVASIILLWKTSNAFLIPTPALHTKTNPTSLMASSSPSDQPRPKQKTQPPHVGFQQHGGPINHDYCRLTNDQILKKMQQRNKARRARNFELADEILANLNQNSVYLHDKKKLWRADGEIFDIKGYETMEYSKSIQSKPISSREEEYVNQKLRERSNAKLSRDFSTADDILDELKFIKNVVVDDSSLTWKVTEPFKTAYTYGGKRLNNVAEEEIQKIDGMIRDRAKAKEQKDYKLADDIVEDLKVSYGVRVDDSKKSWFFLPKFDDDEGYLDDASERRGRDDADTKWVDEVRKRETDDFTVEIDEPVSVLSDHDDKVPDYDDETSFVPEGSSMPDGISIPDGISVAEDPPMPDGISLSSEEDDTKFSQLPPMALENLEACTVPVLKEKLREAGLPVSGRKAELIERLQENQ